MYSFLSPLLTVTVVDGGQHDLEVPKTILTRFPLKKRGKEIFIYSWVNINITMVGLGVFESKLLRYHIMPRGVQVHSRRNRKKS